jgi:aconitate hydratase 2/2-methylisocitrate dehydratase
MGKDAFVYLASAELAAVCALLGRIPTPAEYLGYVQSLNDDKADTYRYMNFDQINSYTKKAENVIFQTAV